MCFSYIRVRIISKETMNLIGGRQNMGEVGEKRGKIIFWGQEFQDKASLCSLGCSGNGSIDQADLELCLPLPPECYD